MKLLHHITRNFLVVTILALAVTGIALYFSLKQLVQDEMIEQLDLEADLIVQELSKGNIVNYPLATIVKTTIHSPARITGDTLVYDHLQHKYEDYKFLTTFRVVNDTGYRINVMTTFVGWAKYYSTIFFLLLLTAIIMAGAGIGYNYFLSRRIWQPFFQNLQSLKNYSLSDSNLLLTNSTIAEFSEMQKVLESMTTRSRRDYLALREFTENASHEIQTPLSIIRSKLERMSQMEMTEELAACIVQAKGGVDSLSRINKNLLLLAKLGNEVYADNTEVWLNEAIDEHIHQTEELFEGKKMDIIIRKNEKFALICNEHLLNILLSNLFGNALNYTPSGGKMEVVSASKILIIKNTGEPLSFPPENIFDRFKKGAQHGKSNGLGLSIVQQICNIYGWRIRYAYESEWHIFEIILP